MTTLTDAEALKLAKALQHRRKLDAVGSKGGSPNINIDSAADMLAHKVIELIEAKQRREATEQAKMPI